MMRLRLLLFLSYWAPMALIALGQDAFVTTWKTSDFQSTNANRISIGTQGAGYNYDVYWEKVDDTAVNGTATGITGDWFFLFPQGGTYRVEISGDFPRLFMLASNDRDKLLTVEQWGGNRWTSMANAFSQCRNVQIVAEDSPDLRQVTDMSSMFLGASSINSDLSAWDVSNVTSMVETFAFAEAFDGDLENWDVSNVTNMSFMFNRATAFNGNISTWDVGNVESMDHMFDRASAFNSDISAWNVGKVSSMSSMFQFATAFKGDLSSWDVSNVVFMGGMFRGATSFNGDLANWNVSKVEQMGSMFFEASSFNGDISSWDVGNVIGMPFMFEEASSFNQNLGQWNIVNVTDMRSMLNNTNLSVTNYDNTLKGWAALPTLQQGVSLDVSTSYCRAEEARQRLISDFGWAISDAGRDCETVLSLALLSRIRIHPNPVTSTLMIKSGRSRQFTLSDLTGRRLMIGTIRNEKEELDLQLLRSGVYLIEIMNDTGTSTIHKIIKR